MKQLRIEIVLVVIIGLLLVTPAAAQETQPTIVEILNDAQDKFSNLLDSFNAADAVLLQELSHADGNYTLFAPTDAAFARIFELLAVTRDEFLAHPDMVGQILAYHIVPGRYDAKSLAALDDALLGTLQPVNVYLELELDRMDGGLHLNGVGTSARLIESDIAAANGIVHSIDVVLLPYADWDLRNVFNGEPYPLPQLTNPLPSLDEVVAAADDLSIFYEAAHNVDPRMLMGGRYTVFAPTDAAFGEAFAALGVSRDDFLQDTDLLSQLLAYHMMPGTFGEYLLVIFGDRGEQRIASALPGTTLRFTVNWRPLGETPARILRVNDANVIRADTYARNGLLHVIDRVLMPPDADL